MNGTAFSLPPPISFLGAAPMIVDSTCLARLVTEALNTRRPRHPAHVQPRHDLVALELGRGTVAVPAD